MNVLFARIGYMQYYQGADTERPVNGGKHNIENIGHEAFNFRREKDGCCYGYVQPPRGTKKNNDPHLNIGRINPAFKKSDCVTDVLVIWVATKPKEYGGGQYVVGWYKNATVYREFQPLSKNIRRYPLKDACYNIKCRADDVVLLPPQKRKLSIPRTNSEITSLGQANIFYLLNGKGAPIANLAKEIKNAIVLTKKYNGPNLKTKDDCVQDGHSQSSYESDPNIRKAIEDYAMWRCKVFYKKKGFHCEDVSQTESYDVLATNGNCIKWIEVKGTRGSGDGVILTKNEVKLAKRKKTILYLLCNIRYDNKTGKVSGGDESTHSWKFTRSNLIPLSYHYLIPEKGVSE